MRRLALLLLAPAWVAAAGPHEHGAAAMTVAVDGARLEIGFEAPLDGLVGFERAPRNEKERQAVQAMNERFRKGDTLFVPTAEAGCTLRESTPAPLVVSGGHADFRVTLAFECARPALLKGIELKLFDAFAGLRRVDAQVASAKGQKGDRLTPQRRLLAW